MNEDQYVIIAGIDAKSAYGPFSQEEAWFIAENLSVNVIKIIKMSVPHHINRMLQEDFYGES